MLDHIPYCGPVPVPGSLAWNFDPALIVVLLGLAGCHLALTARARGRSASGLCGWLVVLAALVSPLCNLSVALFSARVTQHMVIVLIGAPLIASALPTTPSRSQTPRAVWAACAFTLALWFWHMPMPYDATFQSDAVYWGMHLTLLASAAWLAHGLLTETRTHPETTLLAGVLTTIQMSLLGAVLTFGARPLFVAHFSTTFAWGLTPLQDQQLGGLIMWVPSGLVLVGYGLWAAARLLKRMEAREPLLIGE